MASTVLASHGSGIHSARPAGNTVPDGSLYSCMTHSLIYVSSYAGNSWATWASLTGTGLSDPMTTRGDLIVRDSSNVTNRLAIGAAGRPLISNGTDPAWTALAFYRYNRGTAGNYTTSSTSFVDIDGTNILATLATGPHRVRLTLAAPFIGPGSGNSVGFDVVIDGGTREGTAHTYGLYEDNLSANIEALFMEYTTPVLAAGSHTFKWQWKVSAGTATLRSQAGDAPTIFTAEETLLTT